MPHDEVVIYCRISPGDRGGSGVKVENQEADGRVLATGLGKRVRAVYADRDISAAQRRKPRPAYLSMLADLARRPADVIAWHADRLHRQPAELERYIDLVEPRDIITYTVRASPIDLATPTGRMVARMLGVIAANEVEQMRDRQKARKRHDAQKGIPLGGRRPFGYAHDGMRLCHGEVIMTEAEAQRRGLEPLRAVQLRSGDRVAVEIPYDEAAELESAIRKVAAGTTLYAIMRDWNTRGILTASGYQWPRTTEVRRVLMKPRNAGLMEHNGEITGPAAWPAAVDEPTWRKLRAVLGAPGRRTSPGPGRRWLGSGIYECACGQPMIASSTAKNGARRAVYRCRTHLSAAVAPGFHAARDAAALDAYTELHICAWLNIPGNIAKLRRPAADLAAAEKELAAITAELDQYAAQAAARKITPSQLSIASAPLLADQEALEARLDAASEPDVIGGLKLTGAALWKALEGDLGRQRALLSMILNVRVLPAPKGRPAGWRAGMSYFHPDYVEISRKI